jgi:hypothetical protein
VGNISEKWEFAMILLLIIAGIIGVGYSIYKQFTKIR